MLGFIKLKISTKESTGSCSISMAWILITSTKKKKKKKLASGGEDETKKKSKMLGLVIWKLVTCLGSHDEGCLLWGLISSFFAFFLLLRCLLLPLLLLLLLCFFIFIFLPFGSRSKPKYCWSMGRNFAEKRNRPNLKNQSRFSESYGPTTIHTSPYLFPIERFLKLKKSQNWEVRSFPGWTVWSGPGFKTLVTRSVELWLSD